MILKKIAHKTIVWTEPNNQYSVLENTAAIILKKLSAGEKVEALSKEVSKIFSTATKDSNRFVLELQRHFFECSASEDLEKSNNFKEILVPGDLKIHKFYQINNTIIRAGFKSELECALVHPKFAHLEIPQTKHSAFFSVFIKDDKIFLAVNNKIIDSWDSAAVHLFQGKFSMELVQEIHKKEEEKWLGVFHASALANGKKAILFLGDSGDGKSTSLALLQAHGYNCIADDFVPVDLQNQEVYSFPAAISIKKNSLEALLPLYPELKEATEYDFKKLHKIVRYLKPNNTDFSTHLPCKDLVFIKYQKHTKISCSEISKITAFEKLVPDSWLSPKKENVQVFLDWFEKLNCYQLTYSDTNELVAIVSKMFNDDL